MFSSATFSSVFNKMFSSTVELLVGFGGASIFPLIFCSMEIFSSCLNILDVSYWKKTYCRFVKLDLLCISFLFRYISLKFMSVKFGKFVFNTVLKAYIKILKLLHIAIRFCLLYIWTPIYFVEK